MEIKKVTIKTNGNPDIYVFCLTFDPVKTCQNIFLSTANTQ